jgi:hypothetical protein
MLTQDTTDRRDVKAQTLIDTGKVHLILGQRFGYVDGSQGQLYRVSRDGCECRDWLNRQPEGGCAHQRALRAVCALYKGMRAEAKATGRATIIPAIYRALLPVKAGEVPAPVPAGAERDGRGVPYCLRCGSALTPDGRCPRQDERLKELGYGLEAA